MMIFFVKKYLIGGKRRFGYAQRPRVFYRGFRLVGSGASAALSDRVFCP